MQIKLYKPKNILLQEYIECFYTLKRQPEEKNIAYISFPSIFSMICLNANTRMEVAENNVLVAYCLKNTIEATLTCSFKFPNWLRYKGKTDEIVIYFKPLGLNAFLEKNLKQYSPSFFAEFYPFEDYELKMREIFSFVKDEDRIEALEDYWLSKLRGFEHPFLHQVVGELMRDDNSSSISKIALKNEISRTTLIKHFDLHICTTPSQFKKVVRFRNAMKRHRLKISEENLTGISNDANYFDQSHMIKDFKSLTKYSPKTFFSKISALEDGQINWLFL